MPVKFSPPATMDMKKMACVALILAVSVSFVMAKDSHSAAPAPKGHGAHAPAAAGSHKTPAAAGSPDTSSTANATDSHAPAPAPSDAVAALPAVGTLAGASIVSFFTLYMH